VSADEAIAEAFTAVAPESAERDVAERVFVQGLGYVDSDFYNIGRSTTNNAGFRLQVSLGTNSPAVVLIQPRQFVNEVYPDQFAVQVVATSTSEIACRVRRVDADTGWGQELRLDMFINEARV
jgi:hypothetical protein